MSTDISVDTQPICRLIHPTGRELVNMLTDISVKLCTKYTLSHNSMSPARARTWTACSGVKCTNHEATTSPIEINVLCISYFNTSTCPFFGNWGSIHDCIIVYRYY